MSKTLSELKKDYNEKLKVVNKQIDWIDAHSNHTEIEKYIKVLQDNLLELNGKINYIETWQKKRMTAEQILIGFKYSEIIEA